MKRATAVLLKLAARSCAPLCCSERRGQSQKPEEIYQLIEKLVPNGELFSSDLPWWCLYSQLDASLGLLANMSLQVVVRAL
jgi:N6-adenosine-specific RNA methylase IME4